jgi:hypothetical protein
MKPTTIASTAAQASSVPPPTVEASYPESLQSA